MGLRSDEYGGQSSNTSTSFSSNHAIVSLAVCTLALSCIKIGLIPISPNSSKKSSKEKSNVLTYALASTLPPSTTLIPLHVPFNPPAKQAHTICLTSPDFLTPFTHSGSHFSLNVLKTHCTAGSADFSTLHSSLQTTLLHWSIVQCLCLRHYSYLLLARTGVNLGLSALICL